MNQIGINEIEGIGFYPAQISEDKRGTFTRYFDESASSSIGWTFTPNTISVASNIHSGTIRGLHFQTFPFEEEKAISCLQGRIFDVVVDLRVNSKTRGNWACVELGESNPISLILPKGFAHGYQTLEPSTHVLYALGARFDAAHAFAIHYLDPELNISWPTKITEISKKDAAGISLKDALHALGQASPSS